jgi:hypothetical protein
LPTNPEARAAIVKALSVRWDLTTEGIGCGWAGPAAWATPWQADEIETALEFLRMCKKSRTEMRCSYVLKHNAEEFGKANGLARYVSNGSLIVAALVLGFKIEESIFERDPNAGIYINAADLVIAGPHRRKSRPLCGTE